MEPLPTVPNSSLRADSFPAMSCTPIDGRLRQMLDRLKDGRVPADEVPADLLEQLLRWGWVIGSDRLELTGIGIYHAGHSDRWTEALGIAGYGCSAT